ncbi:DHH family phosphoesterase [archaeon]|jgi:single-stranded DNA-specific DHH superfamily exonuclease|nr:DHH family phosphoesterase [archaeon]MBT4241807.1 DHH family phosphoesterase [archaeon]MBT4418355.1 DHH family phosphoesterase [archaeon]
MLKRKQVNEIREHLERAQNPLFFFDNDNDGLCSFLLLRRFIGRGRGVAIKSFPDLNVSYYRKVKELNPDYIFILDKPHVSKEFLEKAENDNVPVVWIDHHNVDKPDNDYVDYYNPYFNDKTNEPVSYLAYKIANKKDDIWLAMIGCISDCYMPSFYKDFKKKYPDLAKVNAKSAFDLLYNSEIGRIARILDFSLKDSITNVVNMIRFMMKVKGPLDIVEENSKTKQILKRYNEINTKYQELMIKARDVVEKNLIFFKYSGGLSISSNIANQLIYEFPNKVIIVVYVNGEIANISVRGKNARNITLKAIEGIDGATGGGHEEATGAKMDVDNLSKFRTNVEELIKG